MKFTIYKHILFIGFVVLITLSCKPSYKVTHINSSNTAIENNLSTDNFSEFDLSQYKNKIDKQMNEVISNSKIEMDVNSPEGLLGNFICDLTLFTTTQILKKDADFCILNNGGFRTSLPKGNITVGKIFELMPFDNQLVLLELDSNQMIELINYIKQKSFLSDSRKAGVPISGMRISIIGADIYRVFIGTKEFDNSKKYKVVTTNYLANGGDQMNFFKNANQIENTNVLLRDAIIDYLKLLQKQKINLDAELDGRIEVSE